MVNDHLSVRRRSVLTQPPTATVAAVAALATMLWAAFTAPATADTARLQVEMLTDDGYPTRIVVTSPSGATRTLGPYGLPAAYDVVVGSPDGRYLALLPDTAQVPAPVTVVPLAGGPPVSVQLPAGALVAAPDARPSWAPDGSALVIDQALSFSSGRGGDPTAQVLRCPEPQFRCTAVPGARGLAVAIPGGVAAASSALSLPVVRRLLDGPAAFVEPATWLARRSVAGRRLVRDARTPVEARTVVVGDDVPRTVRSTRRTLERGVPVATGVVGGSSGALFSQLTYRVTLRTRKGRINGDLGTPRARLIHVRPDATVRTFATPRLTNPARDGADDPLRPGRRATRFAVRPVVALPDSSWLATVGSIATGDDYHQVTLARITADGRAQHVRTKGRVASAPALAAAVSRNAAMPGRAGLSVVGYEQETESAIVGLRWGYGRQANRTATVRVPLDGRTPPTVVSRTKEQAAW